MKSFCAVERWVQADFLKKQTRAMEDMKGVRFKPFDLVNNFARLALAHGLGACSTGSASLQSGIQGIHKYLFFAILNWSKKFFCQVFR